MSDELRYLITTADERTWKFDRPVLFLGEWCRRYERKHIWRDMDAIVAAPYGLTQAQKDADLAEARALEGELFPVLSEALNQYHGAKHGPRFWQIVLGHWLRRYVDVICSRVKTVEQCLHEHQLSGTTAYADDHYALAPMDSYAAIWAFNDDRWNNALCVRILNLLGGCSCPVEMISGEESVGYCLPGMINEVPSKMRILKWGYRQAGKLAGLLARKNDAFIINSYLPRKEELKLYFALGQIPQSWSSPKLVFSKRRDRARRSDLAEQIVGKSCDTLSSILRVMLFEALPVCYLEGFAELTEKVQQLPWPKNPKFIFASNNFDTDEVFKLWAAIKVESGVKYIIGQHGNNYGTYRYMYPAIEEVTADKFLTWGWTDGLPQHTPAFIFKNAGRKPGKNNPGGGLLLIELHEPLRITTWDGVFEFGEYFADQQSFVANLKKSSRENLIVRLHGSCSHFGWGERERWEDLDKTIKLDKGSSPIRNLICESRLIIYSYESSGMLETLSQNIPTLAFWQNGLDHLRDRAKPYYKLLIDAGIVHLTPESAAEKVNEVWDDVEGWWAQSALQEARKQFCDRYAKVSWSPVCELKKILLDDIL